ncbi:MAG: NADH:ubiquinone reductase (Na(+)-transporting) subunit B [Bacteroidetes bacterium CG18_big_fil_WC_8_21_14_2_50_41_14]|nr:MAG: NADH:ubiquinone reductase (Na(+)-transporting) subunit B [Bacteroidetes bacterium CG18_big_fil_WC_8_21_14_2_50_41_14]PJB59900.1 MAG: NADH:ubiquinone reductase (Na(+)-transporting) subunit B [Bacteroidetes bacterium CG_4_9_14_3_um_filter_41_19]
MKALRKLLDKQKPHFEKGGRFEKFHSAFDSVETLLFVPDKVTYSGSHIRDAIDMKRTMIVVFISLVPALLFGMWNIGNQHFLSLGQVPELWTAFFYGFLKMLPIIIVSYVVGLGIEIIFAQIKGHEVNEGFFVSGLLIPMIVPPETPLWQVAIAVAFAVVFGKEVFGGTGMNIVNPALTARAFLFFAYPADMSGDKVWIADKLDAYSGATPLGNALVGNFDQIPSTYDMFMGFIPGSNGETSVLMILIGAAILLATGIGNWRIMLSVVVGGIVMALLFNWWGANKYMELPFYNHLIMGGFAFGAVFMATDPVTATQTKKGMYIYGFLIGAIAILIRVFNPAYPEGVMLSILLMNVFAPLIDHYVIESNIKKRLKRIKVLVSN